MIEKEIIRRFVIKASQYHPFPALIKDSPCDHNAKICLKHGYVKLTKSTKTGNIYVLTQKGIKFAEKEIKKSTPKIFGLIRI